jgi:PTH1 family peptidyl-tRNA hydrolase
MSENLRFVFGLGNPGQQYERTRHNAGFLFIDRLGTTLGAEFRDSKDLECQYARKKTVRGGRSLDLVLVKPLTYMNLSGICFQKVVRFFKGKPENCIVVHDDVSLPLGKLRFQSAGGAGGQHGIESIIAALGGNKGFDRLKIGVGPDPGGDKRAAFVLARLSDSEIELLSRVLAAGEEGLMLWLDSGILKAANDLNGLSF